jgi:hypothetical protein
MCVCAAKASSCFWLLCVYVYYDIYIYIYTHILTDTCLSNRHADLEVLLSEAKAREEEAKAREEQAREDFEKVLSDKSEECEKLNVSVQD